MVRSASLSLLAASALLSAAPALAAEPVTGKWLTQNKEAVIEIAPCGSALCGRTVKYLKTPTVKTDVKNPDPKLRGRKLMGAAILTGLTEDGDVWRGEIYDPRSGKTYRSIVEREGSSLKVKGCLGPFCGGETWTRAN